MNKILKLFIFTALLSSSVLVHAKDLNPHKDSYGAWKNIDGSVAEDFLITKQGFDWLAKLPKKCQRQTVKQVSGQDVLKRIQDSIQGGLISRKDVRVALEKIKPNQYYQQIEAVNLCERQTTGFIFLDKHHALGLIPAPEDWFMDLRK